MPNPAIHLIPNTVVIYLVKKSSSILKMRPSPFGSPPSPICRRHNNANAESAIKSRLLCCATGICILEILIFSLSHLNPVQLQELAEVQSQAPTVTYSALLFRNSTYLGRASLHLLLFHGTTCIDGTLSLCIVIINQ
jgi:hypothetical protein